MRVFDVSVKSRANVLCFSVCVDVVLRERESWAVALRCFRTSLDRASHVSYLISALAAPKLPASARVIVGAYVCRWQGSRSFDLLVLIHYFS